MTSGSETSSKRGGIELLPLAMVAAVAVMLLIAGQIDRTSPGGATTSVSAAGDVGDTTAVAGSATVADASGSGAVEPAERARIEGIVKNYLLTNPEIMLEVQNALEQKMETQRTAQMATALKEQANNLYRAPNSPSIGAAQGDVTVVEFFDYNCGYCRRALPDLIRLASDDPKVKIVFKEFPIFGKDSEAAARIALAAGKQGKYWDVHKGMFEHEGKLDEQVGLAVAEKLGLDITKLKADMTSPEVQKEIDDTRELAESLGIQGTPHFFLGEQVIPGAPEDLFDQLQSKIADIRKTGCSVC